MSRKINTKTHTNILDPATLALAGLILLATTSAHSAEESAAQKEVTVTPENCTIEKFVVGSKCMQREIKAVVVLPPAYAVEPGTHFPVLYALHGMHAPFATWSEMRPLRASLRDRPMIVASFDGDPAGFYIDATKKPDSKFATFFFEEFIPYIETHYRAKTEGAARGLTGFSMGGYGAFQYMLTHPEMFASVSTLSGAFRAAEPRARDQKDFLVPLLGELAANKSDYANYGIYNRLEAAVNNQITLPPLFIHCGVDDHLIEENRSLLEFFLASNQKSQKAGKGSLIQFQYKESPGAHSWPFWRDASAGIADFHWRSFQPASPPKVAPATSPTPKG